MTSWHVMLKYESFRETNTWLNTIYKISARRLFSHFHGAVIFGALDIVCINATQHRPITYWWVLKTVWLRKKHLVTLLDNIEVVWKINLCNKYINKHNIVSKAIIMIWKETERFYSIYQLSFIANFTICFSIVDRKTHVIGHY